MKYSIFFINIIMIFSLLAQNGERDGVLPERQFDFWLGEWELTWGEDGQGFNHVHTILEDKVIQENFDGRSSMKLRGKSWSVYDQQNKIWQQTWVDNQGGYLDFSGGWQDGKMILSREFKKDGAVIRQRMVWYNISENQLDWNWERSTDGGENWEVLWKIHYQRKPK